MSQVVTILQHRLLHYRVDFFQQLHDILQAKGIDLQLIHGQASPTEKVRKDEGYLAWAIKVHNKFLRVFNVDLVWQPIPKHSRTSDLIILMQENRLLSNYSFLFRRMLGNKKLIAFWGHGVNFQSKVPGGFRERFKKNILTKVDWWFAYTNITVEVLKNNGFPTERITCLDNAIDTFGFGKEIANCTTDTLDNIRQELQLGSKSIVGLYCGSLYPDKRLDLMVAAADIIYDKLPSFRLIIIGDGPSAEEIKEAFSTRDWCHWVGVQTGAKKAAYYKLAKVNLSPGSVGLHVLDAFAAGLPMISTKTARHGPEIAYLENNHNGLLTSDTALEYANAVIQLLLDNDAWDKMSKAAATAAEHYTVENMVHNFAEGLVRCLENKK